MRGGVGVVVGEGGVGVVVGEGGVGVVLEKGRSKGNRRGRGRVGGEE